MRSASLRFRPPDVAFDPSLRWVLLRAFADPGFPVPEGGVGERSVDCAGALDLAARIGCRVDEAALRAEVGDTATVALLVASTVAEAQAQAAHESATLVAELAGNLGVPVVLLKSAALHASGVVRPGSRPTSDVDALVSAEAASHLASGLDGVGFHCVGGIRVPHQLPMRTRAGSASIELHTRIPGVRVSGQRWTTLEDLLRADLVTRAPGFRGECFVPRREVLVAHALAHGVAQHGMAPASYPLLRMVADLVDLGFAGADGLGLATSAATWTSRDVSRAELDAVRRLCVALESGDPSLFDPGLSSRPEAVVLRHAVAGATDPGYRESLKLRGLFLQPHDGTRLGAWLTAIRRALLISRAEVDAIYGRPASELGYAGRRLARPFDLLWRALRSGASWLILRARR